MCLCPCDGEGASLLCRMSPDFLQLSYAIYFHLVDFFFPSYYRYLQMSLGLLLLPWHDLNRNYFRRCARNKAYKSLFAPSSPPLGAQAQLPWMGTDTEQLITRILCCRALVMACKRVQNMRKEQAVIGHSNGKQTRQSELGVERRRSLFMTWRIRTWFLEKASCPISIPVRPAQHTMVPQNTKQEQQKLLVDNSL